MIPYFLFRTPFLLLIFFIALFQHGGAKDPQQKTQKVVTKKVIAVKPKAKKLISQKISSPVSAAENILSEEISFPKLEAIPTLEGKLEYITKDRGWKNSKVGIAVYSLTDKELVFSKNFKQQLTPASTTKLFTTFAALEHFGPNYLVPTEVYTDKQPENGIVKGNLYVFGTGDPKLSFQDLESLAEKIQNKGITKIEGSICADGSFFDNQIQRSLYSGDNEEVQATPAIKALCLANPSVTVVVAAGSSGGKVSYSTVPPSSTFELITPSSKLTPVVEKIETKTIPTKIEKSVPIIVKTTIKKNTVTKTTSVKSTKVKSTGKTKVITKTPVPLKSTIKQPTRNVPFPVKKSTPTRKNTRKKNTSKGTSNLNKEYEYSFGDYILPENRISIDKNRKRKSKSKSYKSKSNSGVSISESTVNIKQVFTVSGNITSNQTISKSFPIRNVDATIAGIIHNRLQSGNVIITGSIEEKKKGANAILLTSFVRPFSDIISIVNKNSNNYYAEQVFKMIGGVKNKDVNTAKNSRAIIKEILEINGVNDVVLNDGSGLSRRNLITVEALVQLLIVAKTKKYFKEFYNSMTVAGVDGTTRSRMKGTCAEGNCRAKTGTLRDASALAGYVTGVDGKEYAFAIISNGNNVGGYKKLENLVVQTIASFKDSK